MTLGRAYPPFNHSSYQLDTHDSFSLRIYTTTIFGESVTKTKMIRAAVTGTFCSLFLLTAAQDAAHWNQVAKDTLDYALKQKPNVGIAKNVVVFLGDGMDTNTIVAARIYRGQQAGRSGEDDVLTWERFPNMGMSKTYCTDHQITDSAASATAIFCGVKSKFGTVGVDDRVERGDCSSIAEGGRLVSILKQANRNGKATGIVTTARVTHATPSALYANAVDRNWEVDGDVPPDQAALGCMDIARQLEDDNAFINVIMGGGRRVFLPNTNLDPEYWRDNVRGSRTDGRDLTQAWLDGKEAASYVWNKTAFDNVDPATTKYLLGLFEPSHMNYDGRRSGDGAGEPSIAEMTEKAIKILQKNNNGFFLAVEGARIDHAHHDNIALDALRDAVALDVAVATAVELTNSEDTLIILTADHGHSFTFTGFPSRGHPILSPDDYGHGTDNLPYLTLTYANGPGGEKVVESYNRTGKRPNHLQSSTDAEGFQQDAIAPTTEGTHGGTDVVVHAVGPWSQLFFGVHEENYVAHVVRFAACLDDTTVNACDMQSRLTPEACGNAHSLYGLPYAMILALSTLRAIII